MTVRVCSYKVFTTQHQCVHMQYSQLQPRKPCILFHVRLSFLYWLDCTFSQMVPAPSMLLVLLLLCVKSVASSHVLISGPTSSLMLCIRPQFAGRLAGSIAGVEVPLLQYHLPGTGCNGGCVGAYLCVSKGLSLCVCITTHDNTHEVSEQEMEVSDFILTGSYII